MDVIIVCAGTLKVYRFFCDGKSIILDKKEHFEASLTLLLLLIATGGFSKRAGV